MGQRLEQSLLRRRNCRQILPIVILAETLPAAKRRIHQLSPSIRIWGDFAHIREVVDSPENKRRKQRGVHPDIGLISAPTVFTKLSSMIGTAVPPVPAATGGLG